MLNRRLGSTFGLNDKQIANTSSEVSGGRTLQGGLNDARPNQLHVTLFLHHIWDNHPMLILLVGLIKHSMLCPMPTLIWASTEPGLETVLQATMLSNACI